MPARTKRIPWCVAPAGLIDDPRLHLDLSKLHRRELQDLAKVYGITANARSVAIIAQLAKVRKDVLTSKGLDLFEGLEVSFPVICLIAPD